MVGLSQIFVSAPSKHTQVRHTLPESANRRSTTKHYNPPPISNKRFTKPEAAPKRHILPQRHTLPEVVARHSAHASTKWSTAWQNTASTGRELHIDQDFVGQENSIGDTSHLSPSTANLLQTAGDWKVLETTKDKYLAAGEDVLKVMNLNLWGLGWPLAEDKDARMLALREELQAGDYDIVMLQELWYRADYDLLRTTMPYVSQYDNLNSGCTSFLLPLGCSGLTVLSRHPIVDVRLIPFNHRGNFWRFDGEIFVRKGLGAARILYKDKTIDVFTTHLVSYTKADDNKLVRYQQAQETVSIISNSDADIQIFGGDINATPIDNLHQPYGMLSSIMKDALLEKYSGASFHPIFATFGNSENTYTRHYKPERIDYLMYRSTPSIKMTTLEFNMPIMLTRATDGRIISVSDHEPLAATFLIQDFRNASLPRSFN